MTIYQYPPAPTFTTAIKSIQPFSITLNATSSGTATIIAVDTSKAYLVYNGVSLDATAGGASAHHWFAKLVLTNSTTVTASRGGITGICIVNGMVIELL